MSLLWIIVNFGFIFVTVIPDCQVKVYEPWPTQYTFVPNNSEVRINCTSNINSSLRWAITFAGDESELRFTDPNDRNKLHNRGVFELSSDSIHTPKSLRLLFNDTARNNETKIVCTVLDDTSMTTRTTLSVFEHVSFTFVVLEKYINAINISWNPSMSISHNSYYILAIIQGSSSVVNLTLNEPYYYFNNSDSIQPCAVYTFNVSTSYNFSGISFTGDSCSITGTKSIMLPSLPNISSLELSIINVLKKISLELILVVSFQAASSCDQYPVLNYTVEIEGPVSYTPSHSVSPGVENFIFNLTENSNYSFQILATNSVGMVKTSSRPFYTTDVQNVSATLIDDIGAFVIQCDFLFGSNAKGCMVVLVNELENITQMINITTSCKMKILNTTEQFSFHKVFAYDIEADGSIGHLKVPGVVIFGNESKLAASLCQPTTTTAATSRSDPNTKVRSIIGSTVASITAIIVMASIIVISTVICYNVKRSKKSKNTTLVPLCDYSGESVTKCSDLVPCTDEELQQQAGEILYDQPIKALERNCGDGTEHEKTKHNKDKKNTLVDREMNTYAELVEENHHYHTLEPQPQGQGANAPILPPAYKPPSPTQDQPLPEYQEIGVLLAAKSKQGKQETLCDEVINDQYQPSTSQVQPDESHTQAQT